MTLATEVAFTPSVFITQNISPVPAFAGLGCAGSSLSSFRTYSHYEILGMDKRAVYINYEIYITPVPYRIVF
jgi:hypothetical protein